MNYINSCIKTIQLYYEVDFIVNVALNSDWVRISLCVSLGSHRYGTLEGNLAYVPVMDPGFGSWQTQYLTWFGKSLTSTGKVDIIRDKEREQLRYMEKKDYIHSTLLPLLSLLHLRLLQWQLPLQPFSSSLLFYSPHTLTSCSPNNTSIYRQ
jgi:hypothetical protein